MHYTGFPTPEVHWYREGVEIQPSRDFQITHLYQKSYLVVPEVFLEDAGTFTVRAISPVGMAECRALLVVDGRSALSERAFMSLRGPIHKISYDCLTITP